MGRAPRLDLCAAELSCRARRLARVQLGSRCLRQPPLPPTTTQSFSSCTSEKSIIVHGPSPVLGSVTNVWLLGPDAPFSQPCASLPRPDHSQPRPDPCYRQPEGTPLAFPECPSRAELRADLAVVLAPCQPSLVGVRNKQRKGVSYWSSSLLVALLALSAD